MSITGHISIESPAIYQHVREDEKLSMGISLTYSLIKPCEVEKLQLIITNERKALMNNSQQSMPLAIEENTTKQPEVVQEPPAHALDPANKNLLPLESALVPYQPPENVHINDTPDFDLMELLQEFKEGDVFEDQMVVAASQVESSMMTTSTKTAIIKKKSIYKCTTNHLHQLFIWKHRNSEHPHT